MDAKTFYDTVRLMRRFQKEYARTRSGTALQYSKDYERLIDEEIERVEKIEHKRLNQKLQF